MPERTQSPLGGLFLLLCIPFFIVVGMVWTNYASSEKIARDTANDLIERTRHETVNSTQELIEPISSLVRVAASLGSVQAGYFHSDSSQVFLDAMLAHSMSIDSVYVAYADGSFRASSRLHAHTKVNSKAPPESASFYHRWIDRSGVATAAPQNKVVFLGAQNQTLKGEILPADFDPTGRPWFKDAVTARKLIISDPYVFATADVVGVTIAMPFYVGGQLAGVVGADITLDFLAQFLATRPVSKNSISLIVDASNRVVAHPDPQQAFRRESGGLVRNSLQSLSNSLPARAMASVADPAVERFDFVDPQSGQRHLALRSSLPAAVDKSWSLLIVTHLSDFSGPLADRNDLLLKYGLAAIVLEMLLIVPLSRRIARNRNDKEAAQHQALKVQQDMVEALKTHERDLEDKVIQRTQELEASNQKLAALSATDAMTGIANRRRFDEVLAAEWSRATRSGQPLALAMVDVDRFKKYNDHYGHQAGDECLRKVASVLTQVVSRKTDTVARYGGEEFAFIAPGISPKEVSRLAQSVCQVLQEMDMPHAASEFGCITASVGVAVMVPQQGQESSLLVKAADEALYAAKEQGRNRYILAKAL